MYHKFEDMVISDGIYIHGIYIHFIKPGLLDLFIIHFQFFFQQIDRNRLCKSRILLQLVLIINKS